MGKWLLLLIVVFQVFIPGVNVCGLGLTSLKERKTVDIEQATWRFEFDNDVFFKKDNKISSGWSLQKHSAVAKDWESLQEVPDFVKLWGRHMPILTKEGMRYRAGIAIGQVLQTPDDLSKSELQEGDVPYAGVLTVQATWYAFNDDEFRGFEITVGMVGPPTLGEQTQTAVHELIGSERPLGWKNQLSTEPVINLNFMHKQKIWQRGNPAKFAVDTAINANIGLGNLFTQASGALEVRFGYNMPQGFVYVPDPIGLSMHYIACLKPTNTQNRSFYATLVVRGTGYLHNIFLDGNTFRDSHSVNKKPLVGLAVLGIHYEGKSWGINCSAMSSTENVDTEQLPNAESREHVGSIYFSWRF